MDRENCATNSRGIPIKENGKKTHLQASENNLGLEHPNTKEILKMEPSLEQDFTKDTVSLSIEALSSTINSKEWEELCIQTDKSMKDSGKTENTMAKASTYGLIVLNT